MWIVDGEYVGLYGLGMVSPVYNVTLNFPLNISVCKAACFCILEDVTFKCIYIVSFTPLTREKNQCKGRKYMQ